MWPRSSSTGTVSVNVPSPVSRITSVIFSPAARCSQNSPMPPAKRNSASRAARLAGSPALGADDDGQAGDEVGGLPGPLGEAVVGERGVAQEHLAVRPEPDPGAGPRLRGTLAIWRRPDFRVKSASGPVARRTRRPRRAGSWSPRCGRPGPPRCRAARTARSPRTRRPRAGRRRRCRSRRRTCRPRAAWSSRARRRTAWSSRSLSTGMPRPLSAPRRSRRRAGSPRPWCSGRPAPRLPRCRRSPRGSAAGRGRRWSRCTCRGACAPRRGPRGPTGAWHCRSPWRRPRSGVPLRLRPGLRSAVARTVSVSAATGGRSPLEFFKRRHALRCHLRRVASSGRLPGRHHAGLPGFPV